MVLESAVTEEPFQDDNANSNSDPYASTSNAPANPDLFVLKLPHGQETVVDLTAMPRRFSVLGTKPHPPGLVSSIRESCIYFTQIMHRAPTEDETNALGFHLAKGIRYTSFGTPVGAILATLWASRSDPKLYRFPFWTPMKEGGRFSPEVFGPLRGQMAKAAWNTARLSAYWMIGTALAQVMFGMYGLNIALAGRTFDPRLAEFKQVLERHIKEGRALRMGQTDTAPGPKGTETFEQARQRQSVQDSWQRRARQAQQSTQAQPVDDASPTGGSFTDEYMDLGAEGGASQQEQQSAWNRNTSPVASSPRSDVETRRGQADAAASASSDAPARAGSAWDRVRANAMSTEQGAPHDGRSQRQPSPAQLPRADGGDNFEAQMERERVRTQSEDRSSNGSRW